MEANTFIPQMERAVGHCQWVKVTLEQQLGQFLRLRRGDMTYAQFARKLGLPQSTVYRLERGEQSITLRRLQQVLDRLKCDLSDIFQTNSRG
jgi:transcriptional regulator with XRE-family HTH domain